MGTGVGLIWKPRAAMLRSRCCPSHRWRYALGKELVYPESLPVNATFLESELCNVRDKQIVHDFNPRKTRGPGWSTSTKDINLSAAGYMYPKPTDVYTNCKGWNELLARLDEYMWEVLRLVQANRSRSRLAVA